MLLFDVHLHRRLALLDEWAAILNLGEIRALRGDLLEQLQADERWNVAVHQKGSPSFVFRAGLFLGNQSAADGLSGSQCSPSRCETFRPNRSRSLPAVADRSFAR